MLGAQLAQCESCMHPGTCFRGARLTGVDLGSRTLASSSSARAASLHTSAVLQAVSARTRRTQRTLKANIQRREELEREAQQNRPHVVLGHKAGDEAKWLDSDLAQVLITEEDVRNAPKASVESSTRQFHQATFFNYGIGETEKEVLFDALPKLSVQGEVEKYGPTADGGTLSKVYNDAEMTELGKRVWFARLVDLRNANARGIAYENRRRIVAAFSEPENPTDTGRPEVQGVLCMSLLQLALPPLPTSLPFVQPRCLRTKSASYGNT